MGVTSRLPRAVFDAIPSQDRVSQPLEDRVVCLLGEPGSQYHQHGYAAK